MAPALLRPADTVARDRPAPAASPSPAPCAALVLPIDELTLPDEGVSDLRDVVDAINKLCETMRTPDDDDDGGLVDPAEVLVTEVDTYVAEKWSEPAPCEPLSEMYYTASSEVSLLSDADYFDRVQGEDLERERDDRNSVMAGHVAAMRERFESMTRTNTPCPPDLMRSTSPSFEIIRNISTSPDVFDKS